MSDDFFQKLSGIESHWRELRQQMSELRAVGESAAGAVTVKVNGDYEAISIEIEDGLFALENKRILEDLVAGAFNSAVRKMNQLRDDSQREFAKQNFGGIPLPTDLFGKS